MKKKYVDPEVEIVEIDEADIIFSSGMVCGGYCSAHSCDDCPEEA